MTDELRFPGYNVLDKRYSLSWNEVTRQVVDKRLAVNREPQFFSPTEWETLQAVCARILPQPGGRPAVPLAAYVDEKVYRDKTNGTQLAKLPRQGEAWQRALKGIDEAAEAQHGTRFHLLNAEDQDALLKEMQSGTLKGGAWGDMPCDLFFGHHLLPDIINPYYAHPTAWSEIGYGGPASPRGYVRMGANRRDPWEAVEAAPGEEDKARKVNRHVG